MDNGRHPLTSREKELYQQIHPAKLGTDVASFFPSTYLIWIHQPILGILAGFVPAILASGVVMRYADLESLATTPFGKYVAKYMTRPIEALRFIGLFVSWAGAWYHSPWIIGVGVLIVILAWLRGKIIP